MDAFTVRGAKLSDASAIAGLITQLGYPTRLDEMAVRLDAILGEADAFLLVAEVAGEVVGLTGARLASALERDGRHASLLVLVVDEEWQGNGIGKRLLDQIETWAMGKGATLMILTSSRHRLAAHEFYRRLGYQETGLRLAKQI
jgi:GNAT superfamily N-acetyltransferase